MGAVARSARPRRPGLSGSGLRPPLRVAKLGRQAGSLSVHFIARNTRHCCREAPPGRGPPGPTLQKVAPDTVPGSCVGLLKPPKSAAGRGPKSGAGQDKGSPDNTSRLEAASKWTRVRRTTPGFAGQPARLEAASKWTRVRRTTPGVRRTTLHDLRRPPNWTRVCRTTPSRLEAASKRTRVRQGFAGQRAGRPQGGSPTGQGLGRPNP